MPFPEKQLIERDAKRDIGAELLKAVREMKAGKGTLLRTRVNHDALPVLAAKARKRVKASNKTEIVND